MKSKEQINLRAKYKIEDVERKLKEIKAEYTKKNASELSDEAQTSLTKLKKIGEEIDRLYQDVRTKQISGKLEFDEFEKNIYKSIESFHDAYKTAGSFIKTNVDYGKSNKIL
jgi:predicted outer membrane protein